MNSCKKKKSNRTACIHVIMFNYIFYQHNNETGSLRCNFRNSSILVSIEENQLFHEEL